MFLFFCTIRNLNFGTKFPEGWVYVTTLVDYMFRDYKKNKKIR
jgi:hypothetical protein